MTVNVETPIASSLANGVTTVFPHSFTVLDSADLVVQGTLAGVVTTYVDGVDYTVNGVGTPSGDVTFAVAPANNTVVTRYRDTQLERATDYQQNGDFPAQVVNLDLDRLWLALQDLFSGSKGPPSAIRAPNGVVLAPLPGSPSDFDGYYIGFVGGQPNYLLAPSGTAGALAGDLANTNNAGKGPGQIGFNQLLDYVPGTVGQALNDSEWSLMWFSAVRAAVEAGTDATSAVAAVMALKVAAGGGGLYAPRAPSGGAWLFAGGVASGDGYKNGVLFPFGVVNNDSAKGIQIRGERGTVFKCGANNMVLARLSRNSSMLRDVVLDANGHTSVVLCAIAPEDMTQTSTLVSNSFCVLENVDMVGGAGVEGLIIQPGPTVGGSDSGCFHIRVLGGYSNFVGGGRHVWLKKNADFGTNPRRPTRTFFKGRVCHHGNTAYQIDVGSEIVLEDCYEESIVDGVTPNANPTARYVGDDVAARIIFRGGYSEIDAAFLGTAKSTRTPKGGKVISYDYSFNTGLDVNEWNRYAISYNDGPLLVETGTITVAGGGGTQGAGTGTYRAWKEGKFYTIDIQVSRAIGSLTGNLQLQGLPLVALGTTQVLNGTWGGLTLTGSGTHVSLLCSSAAANLRRTNGAGGADSPIDAANITGTLTLQYKGRIEIDQVN